MAIKVIKTLRVKPSTNSSNEDKTLMNLPLTFFDLLWLRFHPNQRVIFYKLTDSSSSHDSFYSFILPKLESSLSLVLNHYLPLAGRITWDPQDPNPCLVVSNHDDAVSLTVAETDADFFFLSGDGLRPAAGLHPLLPELAVSEDSATVISLQITLFPGQGFCIGVTSHHAVIDGKSSTMFLKSWAHICMLQENNEIVDCRSLPDDLTPSFDRTVINIPRRLDEKMIEMSMSFAKEKDNSRSLKLIPMEHASPDVVRVTLQLTLEDIEKFRERVKKVLTRSLSDEPHLSTFVTAYAYAWTCLVKMRGGEANRPVHFIYVADMRLRLNPPAPATYFGNCMFPQSWFEYEAGTFLEEEGFVRMVKILSDSVKGLGSKGIELIFEDFLEGIKKMKSGSQLGSVAGSTWLGVYGLDFGWGRPVKTEVVSIDRNEALSMSERRDEKGGVEMGVCLKKSETDTFLSLFKNGLND